ncbi:hypothetical protein KEM52_003083, partial [Ascosphaera acerosa]
RQRQRQRRRRLVAPRPLGRQQHWRRRRQRRERRRAELCGGDARRTRQAVLPAGEGGRHGGEPEPGHGLVRPVGVLGPHGVGPDRQPQGVQAVEPGEGGSRLVVEDQLRGRQRRVRGGVPGPGVDRRRDVRQPGRGAGGAGVAELHRGRQHRRADRHGVQQEQRGAAAAEDVLRERAEPARRARVHRHAQEPDPRHLRLRLHRQRQALGRHPLRRRGHEHGLLDDQGRRLLDGRRLRRRPGLQRHGRQRHHAAAARRRHRQRLLQPGLRCRQERRHVHLRLQHAASGLHPHRRRLRHRHPGQAHQLGQAGRRLRRRPAVQQRRRQHHGRHPLQVAVHRVRVQGRHCPRRLRQPGL